MSVIMLTSDELQRLRAPFPLAAHTAREGHRSKNGKKIRWFVYIERNEVQDRLEEIFPGEWGTERPELHIQANKVSAVVGITIRGITRWDGGEDDSNEGTKGALTNAFRRTAAYGWHIGRYLYDMDVDIWTDSYEQGDWDAMKARKQDALKQFEAWYKRLFSNAPKPAAPVGIPTQVASISPAPQNGANGQPSAKLTYWVNKFVVNLTKKNTPYLIFAVGDNEYAYSFTRKPFEDAGYDVTNWKTVGNHEMPVPANITVQAGKDGVLEVKSAVMVEALEQAS